MSLFTIGCPGLPEIEAQITTVILLLIRHRKCFHCKQNITGFFNNNFKLENEITLSMVFANNNYKGGMKMYFFFT